MSPTQVLGCLLVITGAMALAGSVVDAPNRVAPVAFRVCGIVLGAVSVSLGIIMVTGGQS